MISAITSKHREAGHPGVRRTLYFARRDIAHSVTRGMVQSVLARCEVCQSVDPAPVKWRHGSLEVSETWRRLAIDITHFKAQAYLTIVDCGPSRFSLWRALRRMDAASVLERLEQIFYERGAPAELLADNDTAFRSRNFAAFASRWGVSLRFRAVYRPSGNSIVERNHRTVKVIAARKQCSVDEAVHLYNISPREAGSQNGAPVQGIYRYQVRDCVQHSSSVAPETSHGPEPGQSDEEAGTRMTYGVGDMVWARKPGTRCTEKSKAGRTLCHSARIGRAEYRESGDAAERLRREMSRPYYRTPPASLTIRPCGTSRVIAGRFTSCFTYNEFLNL